MYICYVFYFTFMDKNLEIFAFIAEWKIINFGNKDCPILILNHSKNKNFIRNFFKYYGKFIPNFLLLIQHINCFFVRHHFQFFKNNVPFYVSLYCNLFSCIVDILWIKAQLFYFFCKFTTQRYKIYLLHKVTKYGTN